MGGQDFRNEISHRAAQQNLVLVGYTGGIFHASWDEALIERKAVFAALCSSRASHRMINTFFGF